MGVDITRQPLSVVMVQLIILAVLFWCRAELCPIAVAQVASTATQVVMPAYVINQFFDSIGPLSSIIVLSIALWNAVMITRIVTRNMVLGTRTYIPSLFFMAISCGILFDLRLTAQISTLLIIGGCDYMIKSFKRSPSYDYLFRCGTLFGTAAVLNSSYALLLLIIPVGAQLFRRSTRETLTAISGFVFSLLTISYIYWGLGYDFTLFIKNLWGNLQIQSSNQLFHETIGLIQLIFLSLIIIFLFLSIGVFIAYRREMRTRAYKIFLFFIWYTLLSVAATIIPFSQSPDYGLVAIGASIVCPYLLVIYPNKTTLSLYWVVLVTIIAANILPLAILF